MTDKMFKTVRPDAKGRITLGSLAEGVSSFIVSVDKDNRIILEPRIEISPKEKWLFNNKTALQKVKQGLEDAALGKVRSRGSFAKYKDEDKSK